MVKLISIIFILTVFEVIMTDQAHAQMQETSVMNVRVEVVDGVIAQRVDNGGRVSQHSRLLPYGVFSLRASHGTEMLISAQKDVEMHCDKEIWMMNSEMAVKKLSNGSIMLRFIANKVFERNSNGLHRGIQSLTIEYL